jgi:hypothetical protein
VLKGIVTYQLFPEVLGNSAVITLTIRRLLTENRSRYRRNCGGCAYLFLLRAYTLQIIDSYILDFGSNKETPLIYRMTLNS